MSFAFNISIYILRQGITIAWFNCEGDLHTLVLLVTRVRVCAHKRAETYMRKHKINTTTHAQLDVALCCLRERERQKNNC